MTVWWEFRVSEEYAHLLFAADEGMRLGDTVRLVRLRSDDPRLPDVGRLQRELMARPRGMFFAGWRVVNRYTQAEVEEAEFFHLSFTGYLEPTGEMCGTEYDYSHGCPECGMPRRQIGNLRLDLRKAPKKKHMAATIADDEWIVSQQLAEILVDARLSGFDLRPVAHKARYEDDPIDWSKVPSGRELLQRAATAGFSERAGPFYTWVNRPEQAGLLEQAQKEHAALLGRRAQRYSRRLPVWHQLVVTSAPVRATPPTRFGNDLFDDDDEDRYRCRFGHVAGLNLLSEVTVARADWDGADICRTQQLLGWPRRRGQSSYPVRVPAPMLLISPRFRKVLVEHKIKGWKADVAYLR